MWGQFSVVSRTSKHSALSTKKYTELVVFEKKNTGQGKYPQFFLQKGLNTIVDIDNFTLLNLLERPRALSSHKMVVVFVKKNFI